MQSWGSQAGLLLSRRDKEQRLSNVRPWEEPELGGWGQRSAREGASCDRHAGPPLHGSVVERSALHGCQGEVVAEPKRLSKLGMRFL